MAGYYNIGNSNKVLQYTFAGESEVINIINSTVLEDIKACLQSGDKQITLKFTNKEDKSRKNSKIDRENNSNKKDKSKENSKINRENNGKNKTN